jgi:L-aminopeptidase/D-esterase-like protein
VDVRGGWVGRTQEFETSDAICLTGGSLLGLEAVYGVMAGILADREYSLAAGNPVVNGAVIYDYRGRANTIHPDVALGRAAYDAARAGIFPLGSRGAGRSASVGKVFDWSRAESSGQGGAFVQAHGVKVVVFTVLNALGVIVNRDGEIVRGNYERATASRAHFVDEIGQHPDDAVSVVPADNTTLTLVITDQKLDAFSLAQLGRQVHSSMARAIHPFHTMRDGDVLYTVTTDEVEGLPVTSLGLLASEVVWDAVLSAVEYAT